MKKLIKLLLLFFIFAIFFRGIVSAKPFANPIESSIKKADISKSALISASFKDISDGRKVFEMNSKTPMSPASIQKIVTILPSIDTLGEEYLFKTQLYKDKANNLYLKLGADPYFTTKDLKEMIRCLANYKIYSTKSFYIDDSILDSNEWGEGWQWDNDLNPLMPRFGSYNMDKNLITISLMPTIKGAPANILTEVFYPTAFMNNVTTGDRTDVKLERKNYISPDVINADGVISHDLSIQIPINYPRRYFILRLEEILRKQNFSYYGDFTRLKLPQSTYLITEVKHPLSCAVKDILENSNNMIAETVFKLAGGNYTKETGSIPAAIEMFKAYYKKLGISTENIKIVDGSGVSKNNLLTADFMTEILLKIAQNKETQNFEDCLATPGKGTLTNRMLYFKDKLSAKTGTLTNVSAISGYLTAKSGRKYAFCIMINDPKSKSADKKAFEEYVLRGAYEKL